MDEDEPVTEATPVDLGIRRTLASVASENVRLREALREVQSRSTELLLKAREWRRKILELGGEDPGPP